MDLRVGNIVLDGEREYVRETSQLEAEGIKICITAEYTVEQNRRAQQMNRTMKRAIKTTMLHSGAL